MVINYNSNFGIDDFGISLFCDFSSVASLALAAVNNSCSCCLTGSRQGDASVELHLELLADTSLELVCDPKAKSNDIEPMLAVSSFSVSKKVVFKSGTMLL